MISRRVCGIQRSSFLSRSSATIMTTLGLRGASMVSGESGPAVRGGDAGPPGTGQREEDGHQQQPQRSRPSLAPGHQRSHSPSRMRPTKNPQVRRPAGSDLVSEGGLEPPRPITGTSTSS